MEKAKYIKLADAVELMLKELPTVEMEDET